MDSNYTIREANQSEYKTLGELISVAYSSLDGFPSLEENPEYYTTFSNMEHFTEQDETKIIVAVDDNEDVLGGLVFYGFAKYYGSGIINTDFPNTSGIRLLAVKPQARKRGIAKALTKECIDRTKKLNHHQILLHTTIAMETAWKMYEDMGFEKWPELNFELNFLKVYAFKLILK